MKAAAGFSTVEVLLALTLGLWVMLAGSRVFVSALQSWHAQDVAARLQEDARLSLQRMARDIRMAGMFGCLRQDAMTFANPAVKQLFARPVHIEHASDGNLRSLTLISAQAGELGGAPDWTLITDCRTTAHIADGHALPPPGSFAVPLRRQVYRLNGSDLLLGSTGINAVLIGNVSRLEVAQRDDRIMLDLTLSDARHRVRAQTYYLAVTLRNGGSG